MDRLASLRLWRDEKSFKSFVTSQHSPQPSEFVVLAVLVGWPGAACGDLAGLWLPCCWFTAADGPAANIVCSGRLLWQRGPCAPGQPAHEAGELSNSLAPAPAPNSLFPCWCWCWCWVLFVKSVLC
jgi:hypothetical protein